MSDHLSGYFIILYITLCGINSKCGGAHNGFINQHSKLSETNVLATGNTDFIMS